MKINLKKTTKDKLYAMLCDMEAKCEELESSYRQLEADSMKRIDQLNDDLAEAVEAKLDFRYLSEQRREKIDQLEAGLKWVNEHPWKHLWWCLRGKNHEA